MRKGQNPAKFVNSVEKPSSITVAVLNYLPFLSGFYKEGLEVLKICLNSIYLEKKLSFDVMVFDNGSCDEVVSYLLEEYKKKKIQYLILSEKNLGKGGAWNVIFNASPGNFIAYLDSDVKFRENWLFESMRIMTTYPNVGMVTARPFFSKKEYSESTYNWIKTNNVKIEKGKLLPWKDFLEFNLSLGQNFDQIEEDYKNTIFERVALNEVSAIVGASHWQFLMKKEIAQQLLPFDMEKPMGLVKQLDEKIDKAGYLRLMVSEPYADNISNSLDNFIPILKIKKKESILKKIINNNLCKNLLLFIYNKIFEIYYKN